MSGEDREPILQRLHGPAGARNLRPFKRYVGIEHVDFGDHLGESLARASLRWGGRVRVSAIQVALALRALDPFVEFGRNILWEESCMGDCGTDDAERDLLHPSHHGVEYGLRPVLDRKSIDGGGVTSQREDIAPRSTVE